MRRKEIIKIGRYIEFEHEDGICENMLLLTEKETNGLDKQLKELYKKEEQLDQLINNWNELEEWLKDNLGNCRTNIKYEKGNEYIIKEDVYYKVLDKMKELKEGNNETRFTKDN